MSIQYKILFSIELLHDYYRSGLSRDFAWEPAPDCLQLLQNYKLLLKQAGNTLLVLAKADGDQLFIPLHDDLKWRFYLRLQSGNFYTYTNWNEPVNAARKFWASNVSGNENTYDSQQDLLLTAPVAAYSSTADYARGQLVTSGGAVHESLLLNAANGGNNEPLNNADYWVNTGSARQFATEQDVITCAGLLFRAPLPAPVAKVTTAFRRFDPAANDFTITAKPDAIQDFGDDTVTTAAIDTSGLNPGRYELEINGQPQVLYIDPQLCAGDYWGVVEIHHHSGLPDTAFRILDAGTQALLSPRFKIRFRNRSTLWRYVLRSGNTNKDIEDKSEPPVFDFEKPAGDAQAIMSTRPIPITEQPRTSFHLKNGADKQRPLPNPRLDILREAAKTVNGPKYFASEIYLNI